MPYWNSIVLVVVDDDRAVVELVGDQMSPSRVRTAFVGSGVRVAVPRVGEVLEDDVLSSVTSTIRLWPSR